MAASTASTTSKSLTDAQKTVVLAFNPEWTAADKKAVTALLGKADDLKVNKGYIRLVSAGKSLAWINPNHIDFPGDKAATVLSTAKVAE